ncbi:uncharacterized protein KY384_002422 [Bacidia gigantensis]|uniref:uncharacterized protein n=1 Tax=Bacidia gigantensis TaxID=2732470 RepID=UPI001D04596E|nr:uncharacterized protein KY384_002422 [Bacidia gigantensis]KAG8532545.1 hypothetical protein KY384_002422 [Bacidia gigantensis]
MGKRATNQEDYESDGGFIEDAPKSKKQKVGKRERSQTGGLDSAHGGTKDKDGTWWELSRTRRIRINEFKGKTMVDIREYYEKDGETLPGKKGISLNMEQFNTVIGLLPQIERALKGKGEEIIRPDFNKAPDKDADEKESSEEEEEADDSDDDE